MDLRPNEAMPAEPERECRVSVVPKGQTMANLTLECDRATVNRLEKAKASMALGEADSESVTIRQRGFTLLLHLDEIELVRASRITDRR